MPEWRVWGPWNVPAEPPWFWSLAVLIVNAVTFGASREVLIFLFAILLLTTLLLHYVHARHLLRFVFCIWRLLLSLGSAIMISLSVVVPLLVCTTAILLQYVFGVQLWTIVFVFDIVSLASRELMTMVLRCMFRTKQIRLCWWEFVMRLPNWCSVYCHTNLSLCCMRNYFQVAEDFWFWQIELSCVF